MQVRKLVMGLALLVLSAASARAAVTQTLGFGSAVETVERHASFDTLVHGSPLAGYTEDGLTIDLPGNCHSCRGYFYVSSTLPTKISAADGQKLVALELYVDRDSEFSARSIVYWEAHRGGATVGSGIVILPSNSFIGFFDPAGFDELQITAQFYLAELQAIEAVGFANAGPIRNALVIDNLMAEVASDPDADARVGRFDNCPDDANPDQADADLDGVGDVCDAFPDGGSALDQCRDELAALLADPRLTDMDGDGVDDAADRCPDTAAASEVDASGCSVHQFCGGFDASTSRGRKHCSDAIWPGDDPLQRWKADCKVVHGVCVAR